MEWQEEFVTVAIKQYREVNYISYCLFKGDIRCLSSGIVLF